jgi:hypothetical protein
MGRQSMPTSARGPLNIGGEAGCNFPEISAFQSDKNFQICMFSTGKNPSKILARLLKF